ncbi:MAG: HAMP domain-containing histidine kinase [Proteobacteria bacterium]|nr:HAMP domain-containing histidine kinase [Pseudomonadota bacterium]
MAVAAKPAVPVDRDEADPADLAPPEPAAVVIDAEKAEILSANPSGGSALGLFPYASFPVALDPAMPAIARLRQIASTGVAGKGDLETLLFWSSGRLRRVRCKITRQGGKNSKALLLHIESVELPDDALRSAREKPTAERAGKIDVGQQPRTEANVKIPPAALDADYLAKLAHELKTPLTAIAAAAEIMRDERLGEMKNARYLSYAADIYESATHALDVIGSLVSDRAKPAPPVSRLVALDLNAIVDRTCSSVQALAESCGLTLAFEAEKGRPHVVANPTALRQILLNLLTNAIKFTPAGGEVRVVTGRTDDGRVFLLVRDTGCGIEGSPPAVAPSALAAELRPAWVRGSGIGLPLVESLVRDMGADMQIGSAPQKGTAVTIVFSDFTRRFK